jgi:hypothetical protein
MATNLETVTRDLFVGGVEDEVYTRIAFTEELLKRKQITTKGGKNITKAIDYAEVDSLAQAYSSNEPLTDGEKTSLIAPAFGWKKVQLPMKYDGDVEIQNLTANDTEQMVDIGEYIVNKAHRGMKLKLNSMLFNGGACTTATGYNDSGKNFQSLIHALLHEDTATTGTYGGIARDASAGLRNWYQGACPSQIVSTVAEGTALTVTAQSTETPLTIANLRKWIIPVQHHMKAKKDIMVIMCPSLFNRLKAECQAQMVYKEDGDTANVGFNKMYIDNHQIVDCDYLETNAAMKKWVFLLNMDTWEIRINSARNFKQTAFKWCGDLPNGVDYYLARILLAGNCITWNPAANMFLSNVV